MAPHLGNYIPDTERRGPYSADMVGGHMKSEMEEGPKARENFERAMKAMFQVPKAEVEKAEKERKATQKRKRS